MQYNINWSFPNHFCLLQQGSSTKISVQLTPGNYFDEEITLDIAQAMSDAGTQTYSISINYVTETFTVTGSSKNFTIYFTATTLANILGLTANITSTGNALTFQTSMDLLPTTEIQIRKPNLIKNYEHLTNLQQDLLVVASLSKKIPTLMDESFDQRVINSLWLPKRKICGCF